MTNQTRPLWLKKKSYHVYSYSAKIFFCKLQWFIAYLWPLFADLMQNLFDMHKSLRNLKLKSVLSVQFDCSTNPYSIDSRVFGEIRLYLMPVVYSGQIALLKKTPALHTREKSAAMAPWRSSAELNSSEGTLLGGGPRKDIAIRDWGGLIALCFHSFHRVGGPGVQGSVRSRTAPFPWAIEETRLEILHNFIPELQTCSLHAEDFFVGRLDKTVSLLIWILPIITIGALPAWFLQDSEQLL